MLKSRKMLNISIPWRANGRCWDTKIYDFDGKNNISGERIRELRNKKHWSQEQLAAKMQLAGVGIGRDSVNRLEKGKRVIPDYEIRALAEIFDISPSWILGME